MAIDKKKESMKTVEDEFKAQLSSQFYDVFRRVIVSEKATRLAEFENKLIFEVIRGASKPIIKILIENEFKKKVKSVNVINSIKGKKQAIVTFVEDDVASNLSSELGLI